MTLKTQNYNNHIRFYTPHHFVFYPLIMVFESFSIYYAINDSTNRKLWLALAAVFALLGFLCFMMRQHYALINQDRTVRLELRLRYFILTQKRLEDVEARLKPSQLHALRFAPDAELPALVDRALNEDLSGDMIKRAIKQWLPDTMRV